MTGRPEDNEAGLPLADQPEEFDVVSPLRCNALACNPLVISRPGKRSEIGVGDERHTLGDEVIVCIPEVAEPLLLLIRSGKAGFHILEPGAVHPGGVDMAAQQAAPLSCSRKGDRSILCKVGACRTVHRDKNLLVHESHPCNT